MSLFVHFDRCDLGCDEVLIFPPEELKFFHIVVEEFKNFRPMLFVMNVHV